MPMNEKVSIVICTIRLEEDAYALALPATAVRRVVPAGAIREWAPWPGLDLHPEGAIWGLVVDGDFRPRAAWDVEPPRHLSRKNVYPVPVILREWAERLRVEALLSVEGRILPLMRVG